MLKIAGLLLAGALVVCIACSPGSPDVEDISGATDDEVGRACDALEDAGYDFWELDVLSVSGRILEVASSIHDLHPGPEQTQEYCEDR